MYFVRERHDLVAHPKGAATPIEATMNFKEIRDSLMGDDINKGLQVRFYICTERYRRVIHFSSLLLIQTNIVPKFISKSPDIKTRPWYTRIFLCDE